ncbi:DUF58 domain-containing protein [Frigoribacterium faeni]|uniref:DUF58 domain-containing protein n=1 Tax=Frigoribacterium faeni TaxID=145483 RepID=UPI00141B4C1A|nr:uncharacterized protein (DUF58 family) [Frigoribacterium faeni]
MSGAAPGPTDSRARRGADTARGRDQARGRTQTRGGGRTQTRSGFDGSFATGTQGLTNARTRIVGDRTGPVADLLVLVVRLARSARAWLRRAYGVVSGVVTPVGWAMLAVVPVGFVVGYLLGWLELVVVAWAAVVVLLVAGLSLVGRNAFRVSLAIPHERVVVGEPASGSVVVENPTKRRILGVSVEIPVGAGLAEIGLPGLRGGESVTETFSVPTQRRGVVRVGPVRTVRGDAVGLVRRELDWTGVTEMFVHPRTIGIPSTSTGLIRDLEGNPTRDLSPSDISFHALREYQPGDERRNIHWKSTAKTGTYMVRQFEESRRSHIVIALSLATADFATDDEFELAVSVAGSIGARAVRDAREVSVVVSERTPEFAKRKNLEVRSLSTLTRTRLLDDLAVVEHDESALGIVDVARVAGDRVAGVSVAFLVVGSTATLTQLRSAGLHFPLGVEAVAIVCDPEAVPGMTRISDLTVLTIGYLEDLQKSLARAAST